MKNYYVLVSLLLAGCGGGDGGSSTTSNPDSNVTRYSSDYAASDLRVFFVLSVTSPSEAEIEGYVQDSSFNYVAINGGDQLVAEVDSLNFSLAETSVEGGVYYYGRDVSASASEYIVKLLRGNVVQSSLVVNELPLPFILTTSLAGEVIDASWAPEAGHTYSYVVETLTCTNSTETNIRTVSPDINASEHLLNSGSYNKSLSEVFGQTQAQLTQGFDSCVFEMDIIANKNSLPSQTNGQLTFDVVQKRKIKIEL
ncbi:hypothetical protein [Vibrio sp. 10N.261.52.A1]|uniref:hypothetical protein n=1 Tax=Vibrio TaxID=662 RepID=UPI000C860634|nr:hypothetical protein [Vibrio sp. 10N.261.52.A1]PML55817.1 hypothetical protein BCT81_08825 [Vibrio sp. 10N.261.52.A1]